MEHHDATTTEGAPAPLFERLVDLNPDQPVEERPLRVLDRRELAESVRRELVRLLNTRSRVPVSELGSRPLTVLDYGLPDFSGWFTWSHSDRDRLARMIGVVIRAFEPRLVEPRVSVVDRTPTERRIRIRVEGGLRYGTVVEPVSFPLALEDPDRPGP